MKKIYYRYLHKTIRNLKVSEILRICGQIHVDSSCEICPLQKYGICLSCVNDKDLSKIINFRFTYHKRISK